ALVALKEQEALLNAQLAEAMDVEAREQAALVGEREQELQRLRGDFERRIAQLQQSAKASNQLSQQVAVTTQRASTAFDLSEDLTRILIDQQLRDAGWDADSLDLTYAKGIRPEKGRNIAIAEWPTSVPRANADYVLFIGLTPVAIVEAKRKRIN
ncbi:type I restriction-modification system endonuclease, partial [Mycobacterium tuberculosis]